MCGIITSISKQPSHDNVDKVKRQFDLQRGRGTNGFGFVAIQDGVVRYARTETEHDIMQLLDELIEPTLIIFHHRIPTCNYNTVKANHPIMIMSKKNLENKYFIVHNGSIQNTDTLRTEHEKEGFKYHTDVSFVYGDETKVYNQHTDTESLGIEMAKFIERKSSRIKARGGAAIFMLQMSRENVPIAFYAFRENNPINFSRNQNNIFMASTAPGLDMEEKMLYRLMLDDWSLSATPAHLSDYHEIGKPVDKEEDKADFTTVVHKASVPKPPSAEVEQMVSDIKRNSHHHYPKGTPPLLDTRTREVQMGNTLIMLPGKTSSNVTLDEYLGLADKLKQFEERMDAADAELMQFEQDFFEDPRAKNSDTYKNLTTKYNYWRKRTLETAVKLDKLENANY